MDLTATGTLPWMACGVGTMTDNWRPLPGLTVKAWPLSGAGERASGKRDGHDSHGGLEASSQAACFGKELNQGQGRRRKVVGCDWGQVQTAGRAYSQRRCARIFAYSSPEPFLYFRRRRFCAPRARQAALARSPCAKRDTWTPWPPIPTLVFLHATKPCAAPHSRSPIPKPGCRCPFFAHGTIPRQAAEAARQPAIQARASPYSFENQRFAHRTATYPAAN